MGCASGPFVSGPKMSITKLLPSSTQSLRVISPFYLWLVTFNLHDFLERGLGSVAKEYPEYSEIKTVIE